MHSHDVGPEYEFDLSGGVLCLDFANTVSWHKLPQHAADHVNSYADLVAFAEQAEILTTEQAGNLRVHARRYSGQSRIALRRAISYRESLYRAFSALVQGEEVPPGELKHINDVAIQAIRHRRLAPTEYGYQWEWDWNAGNILSRILWPIAQSAAELLTSPQLATLRTCESPDCAWLFLDQSRNHSRRWCDMKVCGNRQKARRHYQRTHR